MTHSHPTLPLIRQWADVRYHHSLVEGRANTDIFGGWGVRLTGPRIW